MTTRDDKPLPEAEPKAAPGIGLDQIVRSEIVAINQRRKRLGRPEVGIRQTGSGGPVLDVVGLAVSGGGIRSAAFSLGVLQSFNEHGVLERVDYLSTVSGGGYMGTSLTATMTRTKGGFVFGRSTGPRATAAGTSTPPDVMDSGSVGHIRNYSNYLIPRGGRDLATGLAIVARGLVANLALVLPVILLLAALTILGNPDRSDLARPDFFGVALGWLPVRYFGVTVLIALLGLVLFLLWAIYRSCLPAGKQSEFRTWLPTLGAAYLAALGIGLFCELQPFVVGGMFDLADAARASGEGGHSLLTLSIQWLAAIAAPIGVAVATFRQQLGVLLKSVDRSSGWGTRLMAVASRAAIWIAGAALPLAIWVGYIHLCYWGIINDRSTSEPSAPERPAIHGSMRIEAPGIHLQGEIDCRRTTSGGNACATQSPPPPPAGGTRGDHTPKWLLRSAEVVSGALQVHRKWLPVPFADRPVTILYIVLGLALLALSYTLRPNANSLHQLYRDRLSKAFLFDPTRLASERAHGVHGADLDRDFVAIDEMRISELAEERPPDGGAPIPRLYAPYHLINAALNVQGSDYANRRGRNADFFLFSPRFVGSEATGYRETRAVENGTGLDLGTAMAVSGAAFSSNMGANSIRPLTPTLALLNIRTGYWLRNPRYIGSDARYRSERTTKWYLWSEITGRLYEDSDYIYITDGGHIENLGVYELLRRRCRIVVVIDAEADPAMRFSSFITLQRYARIDLGVRIRMPWDGIRKTTRTWMGFDPSDPKAVRPEPSHGPHAAIGTIDYDGGQKGWILYIKSSLTGDENDYVRDYARRNQRFPHETTGDQFFSEEQFEVYRALGFHAANRLLNGDDAIEVAGAIGAVNFNTAHPEIGAIRDALA